MMKTVCNMTEFGQRFSEYPEMFSIITEAGY